ncbi:MAG: anhydro-N-acetylmuramic acid kinase [Cytophagales bacterium]|nr:anhydro-N-acetylmuramic acid kinase [Armatimonadota bacterium]
MSGTSADGIDAALVRLRGSERATTAETVSFVTVPLSAALRQEILVVSHGDGNAETVSRLNIALGHSLADAVFAVLETGGGAASDLDAVASHGQTVSHTPMASPFAATLQIGEPSIVAQRIGVPVVSDFRAADMAAGGQGAPLVPYADWCLLTHPTKARAIQNIGGIANVTYLPPDADAARVLGFDTGPGNMLMDAAAAWATRGAQTYDVNGALAASGTVDSILLKRLLDHPFLSRHPPKSAGREEFGQAFFRDLVASQRSAPENMVATLTAFTVHSLYEAYRLFLPQMPSEIIVGGGGARNPTLMRMLTEQFAPTPVLTHEDIGINSEAKEALAFAVLANETLLGKPSNLPSVTGASRRAILGKLTLP